MKTVFVTRHPGAAQWARENGFDGVEVVSHFTPTETPVHVIGTLPVHLAAQVCRNGGRYYHLTLDIPAEERGKELTSEDMTRLGARVEEFFVGRV